MLILTVKAFIDHTSPLYLYELIEQQKTTTNTRLTDNDFLLKLPSPSQKSAAQFFMGHHMNGTSWMNVSDG